MYYQTGIPSSPLSVGAAWILQRYAPSGYRSSRAAYLGSEEGAQGNSDWRKLLNYILGQHGIFVVVLFV